MIGCDLSSESEGGGEWGCYWQRLLLTKPCLLALGYILHDPMLAS